MEEPVSSLPSPSWMRGGEPRPWSWAVERLEAERNYWLVTVRADGFPQARPVWGVWSDLGLLLSVGGGGIPRTAMTPAMPITVHVDSAVDVVIIEGIIDRIAKSQSPQVTHGPTFAVDRATLHAAVARYNEKYSWNFELDAGGLNFLVRPRVVFGWHATADSVEGGTKWTFSEVDRRES